MLETLGWTIAVIVLFQAWYFLELLAPVPRRLGRLHVGLVLLISAMILLAGITVGVFKLIGGHQASFLFFAWYHKRHDIRYAADGKRLEG